MQLQVFVLAVGLSVVACGPNYTGRDHRLYSGYVREKGIKNLPFMSKPMPMMPKMLMPMDGMKMMLMMKMMQPMIKMMMMQRKEGDMKMMPMRMMPMSMNGGDLLYGYYPAL